VLAHLSWTPPNCSSARRVRELLGEADVLARRSGDQDALALMRTAKLFFSAGPATLSQAEAIADEIEREQRNHPETARHGRNMSTLTLRMIIAMQRGDAAAVKRMIQARAEALAKLKNAELDWHHERMLLIQRMNRGEFAGVEAELLALRERAQRQRLQAWPILWRRDFGALMIWTGVGDSSAFGDKIRRALTPSSADSPAVRARKLRSQIDLGFPEDARAALAQLSEAALRDLPGDRDHLSTLTDMAVASAATGSDHSSTLYELLAPFPDYYAVGISFHSNGSVSYYLGQLAAALGRDQDAVRHYERALERNAAFELKPWVAQTSLDLASLLLDSHEVRDGRRALALLEDARVLSETLGLRALEQAIQRRLRAQQTGVTGS
jgi:GGDEF domain-containing protein